MSDFFKRSILAGICIGLGAAINIKLGNIFGTILFSFGLLTVIIYKLPLYTGIAGFFDYKKYNEWYNLFICLFGNIIGCILVSWLFIGTFDTTEIIESRIDNGYVQTLLNAIGCGLIISLIVAGFKTEKYHLSIVSLLLGIPMFILLDFYHSVADSFYMLFVDIKLLIYYIPNYIYIIMGNFIGCNIPRLLKL